MKYFIDGDQICITKDDFVDLQESPAVFYPLDDEVAKTILEAGTVIALPIGDLVHICDLLNRGQVEAIRRFNRVLQAVGPVFDSPRLDTSGHRVTTGAETGLDNGHQD